MRRLPVLLVLLLVLTGCPGPAVIEPESPSVYPHHTAAQIVEAVHATAEADGIHSYTTNGRITLRSPQQNASGTLVLRQRAADTLWASVRGPLNVELLRALATPDSFQVHDRLRNRLYTGPADAARQLFPGIDEIDDLFRSLTGRVIPDDQTGWFANAGTLEGAPIYWLSAPNGRERMAVDPTNWRIRWFERLSQDGAVVDRRRFQDFEPVEGRVLPTVIELSNPAEQTALTIEHHRMTPNPSTISFPFDPRGARIIPIDGPLLLD